jgi:thioredoxin 1
MKKVLMILFFSMISLFAFEELNEKNYMEKISGKNVLLDFHSPY